MEPALNAVVTVWAERGIVGSVVLALGLLNWLQWRRNEAQQRSIDALHAARMTDSKECQEKYVDILVKNLETNNRMADGMEAFERVVDKVKA